MKNVEFCSKCVESSERFIGSVTFADQKKDKKTVTNFEGNVCSGCKYYEYKKTINWDEREKELRDLLDRKGRMMVLMIYSFLEVVEKTLVLLLIF